MSRNGGAVVLSPRARQVLFAQPAFRHLGAAARTQALGFFREVALGKDETVYRAGDAADALYLVVSGAVDLLDGSELFARQGPGQVFGEGALVAGERRAFTVRVALDAVLLVLPRSGIERLLELHPQLHGPAEALLARRLKAAVHQGPVRRPCEVVALSGWRVGSERRAFALGLAHALEREFGRAVAILTVTTHAHSSSITTRPDRPDTVVLGEARAAAALRARVASEVATRVEQAPVVLLETDDALAAVEADILGLADAALVHIEGQPPVARPTGSQRVVYVHDRRSGAGPSLSSHDVVSLPADEARRTRALERLGRHLTHRSVGIALGSGAAWGMAHIGVLDVLERAGIPIDLVAGASMGAIVGAHYALGFSPAQLEEIATRVRDLPGIARILPRLLYLGADFNITRPGLFAGDHFQRVLESLGPIKGRTFADLDIPFRAVATDIERGAPVELGEGDLSDAIRASFSAPWVFTPFRLGDHVLIDGGMSDPVPASTVRHMGADLVIGVNVVPPVFPRPQNPLEVALQALQRVNPLGFRDGARLPNSFDVIVRTLQIMQYELGNVRASEADVLVHTDLDEYWVLDFWKAAPMIAQGRKAAETALPAIRARLARLRGEEA
jgi:NTE family protein